jgi:hypothetical protein
MIKFPLSSGKYKEEIMGDIFARAKELILQPRATWEKIKLEGGTVKELLLNYAAPLALIPALVTLVSLVIIGVRVMPGTLSRAPFLEAFLAGLVSYLFHLLSLLAGAWVIKILAPYFQSKVDFEAAAKLVFYAMTPVWLSGIFPLIPILGGLQILGLYGIYILYLGLPVILDTPAEKAGWFTATIILCSILISLTLTILVGGAVYGPMVLRMISA